MKEQVLFGEDKHEIEVNPITLVFNSSPEESVYLDRTMIDPKMSLNYYEYIKEIDPYSARFFSMTIPDFPYEITKENINKCCLAYKHLIGLFSLSLFFLGNNVKFGWKYPESYLHPKYQGNLADVMITFSDKEKFIRVISEVKEKLKNEK